MCDWIASWLANLLKTAGPAGVCHQFSLPLSTPTRQLSTHPANHSLPMSPTMALSLLTRSAARMPPAPRSNLCTHLRRAAAPTPWRLYATGDKVCVHSRHPHKTCVPPRHPASRTLGIVWQTQPTASSPAPTRPTNPPPTRWQAPRTRLSTVPSPPRTPSSTRPPTRAMPSPARRRMPSMPLLALLTMRTWLHTLLLRTTTHVA